MQKLNGQLNLTDQVSVENRLNELTQIIEIQPEDSAAYHQASQQMDNIVSAAIPIRVATLIGAYYQNTLKQPVTNHELAQLIVAAAKNQDLSEALPLSPDVKTAVKFQIARAKAKMTQAQVAKKAGFSQAQVAKAELAGTTLTMTHWAKLFHAVGAEATIVLR